MLEHGGRRRQAARRFGIPEADWLDLSTGINPHGYPVPAIPAEAWLRLPEDDDGLLPVAQAFYGHAGALPVAGSQIAIQALPRLLPRGRVGVLQPCYAEHAYHWQAAGHVIERFAADAIEAAAERCTVLVLCNPNNPDAQIFAPARLLAVAATLTARGGYLVIDEAFADATPEITLTALAGTPAAPNLVVLRSIGKFFGLAGARAGFVAGPAALLDALREAAGPWPLSGPTRRVVGAALADRPWQAATQSRLLADSARLAALLAPQVDAAADEALRATALFVWWRSARARGLHDALARRGILVRAFDDPAGLRFGLPAGETEWQRLAAALETL